MATLNTPLEKVPRDGQLGEVTVPITQSFLKSRSQGWLPLYRLYYSSVYWITHLEEGPDGKPWYGLTDDRLRVVLYVPAAHIRPIPAKELSPLSPNVPPEEKRLEVSTINQEVSAYERDREVFRAPVSSGIPGREPSPNGIPTDTPQGNFHVSLKTPSRHMGDGNLTGSLEAYELPGVPWVTFFHPVGVGFHGTYWHDNFGSRMSHGCVNMRNEDAKWLYRWTTPPIEHSEWYKQGWGTLVKVE
jgi:lipoprotein-anchoring transpeptidase ErfK/SrfK